MVEFSRPLLNQILKGKNQPQNYLRDFEHGLLNLLFQDKEGNTLLHFAVLDNRIDLVKRLLEQGLSAKKKNTWGMSSIDLAHFLNRNSLLYLLEKKKVPSPFLIYRNRDRKMYAIPLALFEKKIQITYIDYLEFEHPDFLKWALRKGFKRLRREKIRKMNRWMLALHKKGIFSPRYHHIYVRYIDTYLGYGVFAAHNISALSYIGEYTGVVKRRKRFRNRLNDYVFGYMAGPKDSPFVIDAKEKGNFTRFINHSDAPNLSSRWVIAGGITRIIFFANQFIPKGKQLTYDYGKYYWKSRSAPELL